MCSPREGTRTCPKAALLLLNCSSLVSTSPPFPELRLFEPASWPQRGPGGWMKPVSCKQETGRHRKALVHRSITGPCSVSLWPCKSFCSQSPRFRPLHQSWQRLWSVPWGWPWASWASWRAQSSSSESGAWVLPPDVEGPCESWPERWEGKDQIWKDGTAGREGKGAKLASRIHTCVWTTGQIGDGLTLGQSYHQNLVFLCPSMLNKKYGDRVWRNRKTALVGWRKNTAEHSRLVPRAKGNWRGSYSWGSQSEVCDQEQNSESLAFFFFIVSEQSELASGSQTLGSVCLWFIILQPSFCNAKCYKGWSAKGALVR